MADDTEKRQSASLPPEDLTSLTATEAGARIASGALTSEALVSAYLDRIAQRDPVVQAWTWIDPENALAQARHADRVASRGPLHGVPVGIKDIIHTADMPTQMNSPHYQGFRSNFDAPVVSLLRHAGAVILGKLDTVEFAVNGRRARTTNPHDPARTPGGSSSGSGAAVADRQVPLALGTQTGGSVIRPASYCGIPAFKPTWGAVPAEGMKVCAPSLDTIGWYGRSAGDLALLWSIFRADAGPMAPPHPAGLRIGVCRSPVWRSATDETVAAMIEAEEWLSAAGAELAPVELPLPEADGLNEAHRIVMQTEMRASFLAEARQFPDLYEEMRTIVTGPSAGTQTYLDALDLAAAMRRAADGLFAGFDAVLTPSTPGTAPLGPQDTGSATFNRIWTLLHVPVVNLPLRRPAGNLPLGLSLIAPRGRDERLLAVAATLEGVFAQA